MLTCYVVDDEIHALEAICEYIQKTQELKLIGFTTDPLVAISDIRNGLVPDILFSDIEMPKLNGIELVELIKEKRMTVIFTTAHSQYAIDAFDLEIFGYLLKPVGYSKFLKLIQRLLLAKSITQATLPIDDKAIFIKGVTNGKLLRIELSQIVYIESEQNYINVVTEQESITAYMMISEMINYLPENQFSRVHRCFIINHFQINYISDKKIIMKNGVHIPLSNTYKENFLNKIHHQTIISGRVSS